MYRTIMPEASERWGQYKEPQEDYPLRSHKNSRMVLSQSVDYEVDRMTDIQVKRDMRLHPGNHSIDSTCLLKQPMLDGIGKFKSRPAKQKETFGQRNKRLGYISIRSSAKALYDPVSGKNI